MAKKAQNQDEDQAELKQDEVKKQEEPKELKYYVKQNYKSVMYNDCIFGLKSGQDLGDLHLTLSLKALGIEFVNDKSECV